VLNADNTPCEAAAARSAAKVYWFSIEHPVPQGAWLEQGYVVYRSAENAPTEQVMLLSGIPSRARTTLRMCWPRLRGRGPRDSSAGGVRLMRFAAPSKSFQAVEHRLEYVATHQRRRVLQRLQGHQRGRHRQGHRRLQWRHSSHPRRQGQELRLHPALRLAARARQRCLHHRLGGGQDRVASARRGLHHSCETLDKAVAAAAAAARIPARWCCWRRPAPASTSLKTTSSAAGLQAARQRGESGFHRFTSESRRDGARTFLLQGPLARTSRSQTGMGFSP
jgi:hypothetical protein